MSECTDGQTISRKQVQRKASFVHSFFIRLHREYPVDADRETEIVT